LLRGAIIREASIRGLHAVYSALDPPWYCSSLTFSIQSTALPLSFSTMAICDIAVVAVAPCQCFLPGGHQTTSPGRISSLGSPQHCVQPHPEVTIKVCPSGWVCHAVRAPGSNVTKAPKVRAGSGGSNRGSIRTEPVKVSAGPLREGWEPLRLISIGRSLFSNCSGILPGGFHRQSRTRDS